jgi:1,4-dihydroxy-2-naphthoyl-CoA hydrolase
MAAIWHGGRFPIEAFNEFAKGCLNGHLGMEITEAGDDWIRARMPVDERTKQPFGLLHGGASVALAETLASQGAFATLDPATKAAVGMEINANHLRPVTGGWVYGEARPEAMGRTTQVWTIRITDEQGKLVCISRCTMAIIDQKRG